MKRIRRITAAEEKQDGGLDEALDNLQADFDYLIAGLEKLGRSGPNASQQALALAENISNDLARHLSNIADGISE